MRHRQIPITFVNGHLCVMRGWDRALPDGWLVGEAPALPNHGAKKSLLLFYTVTNVRLLYCIILHFTVQNLYTGNLRQVLSKGGRPVCPHVTTDDH